MGEINKGTIASVSGNMARVVPSDTNTRPTAMITIPWHLRGAAGNLTKGIEVVYVEFDDNTGLLLGRADGEWGAYIPALTADSVSASVDVTAGGVSLREHTHGGSASPETGNAVLGTAILGSMRLG